ncbi:sialin-like [Antedon mediterranea]|uniref:sialin-like n=1 Tax=Antedon mediterranea TaxID=105859 RepID=UPI003AF5A116
MKTSWSKEFDTEIPTYAWDEETRQMILSGFYYGYTVTAFPGGWLACRVGGKPIIFCALILSSILTASIPWSASVSSDLLIVLRVLDGMVQGLNNGAIVAILGKWTVPHERSILVSIALFGFTFAQVICNPLSALICSAYKLGGWPISFYTYSVFAIFTATLWVVLIYETRDQDPFISSEEVEYLKSFDTNDNNKNKNISIPWLSLVQSSAVWAVVIAFVFENFGLYFIITEAPTFIVDILGFDLQVIGWISSSLGILSCFIVLLSGACSDVFIRREYFTILQTRKLFTCLGIGLPSFLLIFMEFFKQSAISCLVLIMLAFGIFGCTASLTSNVLDITKHYSGVVIGIMTTLASFSGIVGPTIIGELTKDTNTFEQWSLMFKIVSGVMLFGLTIFLIFAKAEEQFPLNENVSKQEMKSYRTMQCTE